MLPTEEINALLERINILVNEDGKENGKPWEILKEVEKLLSVKWYQFRKMNEAFTKLNELGVSFEEIRIFLKDKPLARLKLLKDILEREKSKKKEEPLNTLRDTISSRSSERYVGSSSPITNPPPSFRGGFGNPFKW